MKYESEITKMIHENATIDFKLGFISEAEMREFDKLCLTEKTSKSNIAHETVNIEPPDLVTA